MSRRRLAALVLPISLALASPSHSAPAAEQQVAVTLTNFSFAPRTIQLVHGQAYALTLSNEAGGGHNFVAPEFFAAARLDAAGRLLLKKGGVEISGGRSVTLHVVAPPAAGRFKVRCTHTLHSTLGMKGEIVVT